MLPTLPQYVSALRPGLSVRLIWDFRDADNLWLFCAASRHLITSCGGNVISFLLVHLRFDSECSFGNKCLKEHCGRFTVWTLTNERLKRRRPSVVFVSVYSRSQLTVLHLRWKFLWRRQEYGRLVAGNFYNSDKKHLYWTYAILTQVKFVSLLLAVSRVILLAGSIERWLDN